MFKKKFLKKKLIFINYYIKMQMLKLFNVKIKDFINLTIQIFKKLN